MVDDSIRERATTGVIWANFTAMSFASFLFYYGVPPEFTYLDDFLGLWFLCVIGVAVLPPALPCLERVLQAGVGATPLVILINQTYPNVLPDETVPTVVSGLLFVTGYKMGINSVVLPSTSRITLPLVEPPLGGWRIILLLSGTVSLTAVYVLTKPIPHIQATLALLGLLAIITGLYGLGRRRARTTPPTTGHQTN